jgi:hypothetical protein
LSKSISIKRNSAIFLATLLVLGTISTILPSAQAQQYYEDNYDPEYHHIKIITITNPRIAVVPL